MVSYVVLLRWNIVNRLCYRASERMYGNRQLREVMENRAWHVTKISSPRELVTTIP
jgi:hypothetical protein